MITTTQAQFAGWLRHSALTATPGHRRLSVRYFALGAFLLIPGVVLGGSAWVLAWPAASCAFIGIAYRINRVQLLSTDKCPIRSRLTRISGWFLLVPYRLGAWCSCRLYSFRVRAWNEATPELIIGRHLIASEARTLVQEGVTAVLDLAPELPRIRGSETLAYRQVAMLDLVPPSCEQLQAAVDFINTRPEGSKLLVHCALGYSRSVAVVVAFLVWQGMALPSALAQVRKRRSNAVLNDGFLNRLKEFERVCEINIRRTDG